MTVPATETTAPTTETAEPTVQETPAPEQPEVETTDTPPTDEAKEPQADGLADLPESWQERIRGYRSKEAEQRVEIKNLKATLEGLKTDDDVKAAINTAVTEYESKVAAAEERSARLEAALKYGLSTELVADLRGTTPEEIDAAAARIASIIGKSAPAPSSRDTGSVGGGLNPAEDNAKNEDAELSSVELARKYRTTRW